LVTCLTLVTLTPRSAICQNAVILAAFSVTCPIPGQESSQDRSAQSARSYEGIEHQAKPRAARRSWPRWSSTGYSMISSARTKRDCGILRPSALAVFMLMTSSNFVDCSTGRSAGLAPLRILSTK